MNDSIPKLLTALLHDQNHSRNHPFVSTLEKETGDVLGWDTRSETIDKREWGGRVCCSALTLAADASKEGNAAR